MEKKSRYMYLVLHERNGEYEYYHRSVHELTDSRKTTMKKLAEDYLREFYWTSKATKADGGYYFHGGEVYVQISTYQMINETEYDVLRKYLWVS